MKKAFIASSFLLLLASVILLKEITFFRKDRYMLTKKNGNVTIRPSKTVPHSADNTEIEILDKTQLLLMNIR